MKLLNPLKTEEELLKRCQKLEGLSLGQLATYLKIQTPLNPLQRKGWIGSAIERALGATAGNQSLPDFPALGIELKTIPLNNVGKVAESTFITSIPLLTIHKQTWETSQCLAKMKKILWMPVEGDSNSNFLERRLGQAILWSPSSTDLEILKYDWQEFCNLIATGNIAKITGHMGEYLQVRPKASNSKSLCYAFDEDGNKILTLPRGFYLRSRFTTKIVGNALAHY